MRAAPALARLALGLGQQRGARGPGAAAIRLHGQPARAAPRARRNTSRQVPTTSLAVDGHQVERLAVAPVAVGRRVHALLAANTRSRRSSAALTSSAPCGRAGSQTSA